VKSGQSVKKIFKGFPDFKRLERQLLFIKFIQNAAWIASEAKY